MHSYDISSSLHKVINSLLWLDHHQMAIKYIFVAQSSQSFYHWGTYGHFLYESAVLDIDVDPVITGGVHLFQLFSKLREVTFGQ